MPRIPVAHIREQGVDLIIVPLNDSFGRKTHSAQRGILNELQMRANSAGLAGTVVPFWPIGRNDCEFIAPKNWHPFLSGLSLPFIHGNLNRELYW